jgi:hypothetical protein
MNASSHPLTPLPPLPNERGTLPLCAGERSRSRPVPVGKPGARSAFRTALIIVLLSDSMLLSGCFTTAPVSVPQTAPKTTLQAPVEATQSPDPRPPATPAVYKRYYVGGQQEGAGRFARSPGTYYAREAPERFVQTAASQGGNQGPTTTWRDSALQAGPLPAEVADQIAEAQLAMSRIATENSRLTKALSNEQSMTLALSNQLAAARPLRSDDVEAGSPKAENLAPDGALLAAGDSQAKPGAPASPATGAARSANKITLLSFRPNSDNLIEITPELAFRSPGSPRVPFDQVYFPKPTLRDVVFHLSLVSPGPNPSAILNKRIIAPGDVVDGFSLKNAADVDEEGVWLSKDFFRIRVPFQETSTTVRFPQL